MPEVNLNKLIAEAGKKLQAVGIDAGLAEAELILCDLLDFNRLHLYLHGPSMIDDEIIEKFNRIVEKRLTRYPLQYILGSAWFYGRKFLVNEDVMVPCPETELLLESILRARRFCESSPIRLLDIGVGSGVVAISAKLEDDNLDVTATDVSPEALHVARVNAGRFEVDNKIRFIQSDLFGAIAKEEKFDIIASNPPYVSESEYEEVEPEVKADPRLSLLAGPRGMDIIERMIAKAPDFMARPGFLMFEIGFNQSQDIFDLVESDGRYSDCSLLKDLSDIDRVVICKVT
jgi:release factor glutamine methyltransferase